MSVILGHERNIRYLERILKRGTLAHAYLFYGPEAVGKKTVALAVAASLLCAATSRRLGGCGACPDCRGVAALAHPDLVLLAPDRLLVEESNRREIGIKNTRELERLLALAPWGGRWKVAIFDGADALSREAQSALLKTVEEPRGRAVIIFITSSHELLLPTLRSRALAMGFQTIADHDLAPLLASAPERSRSRLAELAAGRPGVAVRLARDPAFREKFAAAADGMARLAGQGLAEQFACSEAASREPGETEALLESLLRAGHRRLAAAVSGSARANVSQLSALVSSLLEKLTIARTTAANRRLLADSAFFEWRIAAPEA